MVYFCSCKKCKANSSDGFGCILKTKKTFKRHQKKENLIQSSDDSNLTNENSANSNEINDSKEISNIKFENKISEFSK